LTGDQDDSADKFLHRPATIVAILAGVVTIVGGVVGVFVACRPSPTPTAIADPAQAAVASCMSSHGLSATRTVEHLENGRAVFRGCSWPVPGGADGDGYFVITVIDHTGPGQSEAEGMTVAQYFTSNCQRLVLTYQFTSQGTFLEDRSLGLLKGEILRVEDGSVWHPADPSQADEYMPSRDESIVMSNARYELIAAQCD
jgi:hypothetical protein